jgi:nucleotide-binding universal stress UspA family protein
VLGHLAVGLDGSPHSGAAIDLALHLAGRTGAVLHGVHVIDAAMLEGSFIADITGALGVEPLVNLTAHVESVLADLAETIKTSFLDQAEAAGVAAQFHLTRGAVAPSLVEATATCGMVLVGKQGVNARFHGDLMGPVAERLLRLVSVPVVVTPAVERPRLERLLLAYDGSSKADHALRAAGELARALEVPVTVVTVAEEPGSARPHLERARGHLEPLGVAVDTATESGSAVDGIGKARKTSGADMVCMGAHRRGRIAEMVLGSTAEATIRSSPVPVLCAP